MSTSSTRKGSIGRIFTVIGAAVFVGTALVVALALMTGISALNPFASHTTEHADGVVLAKISDLSRFEAASGRFETIVDEQSSSKLPDWATGERVVLDAQGDVSASVDLSKLPSDAIRLSDDGTSAVVHVPAPTLDPPRLDPSTTRVVARERGLVNRVGDALSGSDPTNDQALYQRAAAEAGRRRRSERPAGPGPGQHREVPDRHPQLGRGQARHRRVRPGPGQPQLSRVTPARDATARR